MSSSVPHNQQQHRWQASTANNQHVADSAQSFNSVPTATQSDAVVNSTPAATYISSDYNYCPPDILIHLTVSMLTKLVTHNDTIPVTDQSLTRFHSRSPPAISIRDYVVRIVRYANLEKAVLLILLIYIDRICAKHESFTMSSLTAHRFIIAAASVASKSVSDLYCTNGYYAKVGGITLQEMNILELEMCKMMNWEMSCQESLLQTYFYNLAKSSDLVLQFLPIPPIHADALPCSTPAACPPSSTPADKASTASPCLVTESTALYPTVATPNRSRNTSDDGPATPSSLPN